VVAVSQAHPLEGDGFLTYLLFKTHYEGVLTSTYICSRVVITSYIITDVRCTPQVVSLRSSKALKARQTFCDFMHIQGDSPKPFNTFDVK
jgi:hypothetical protein